jgi:hypothetical protein
MSVFLRKNFSGEVTSLWSYTTVLENSVEWDNGSFHWGYLIGNPTSLCKVTRDKQWGDWRTLVQRGPKIQLSPPWKPLPFLCPTLSASTTAEGSRPASVFLPRNGRISHARIHLTNLSRERSATKGAVVYWVDFQFCKVKKSYRSVTQWYAGSDCYWTVHLLRWHVLWNNTKRSLSYTYFISGACFSICKMGVKRPAYLKGCSED